MELSIEKFSPTRAELAALVEKAKLIDLVNPFDDMQLAVVKNARAELRSTRTAITKRGKDLRDDALAFQRAVIATEKELVAIVTPEEERLATLIEAAIEMREREERKQLLPHRHQRLAAIGDDIIATDDELLAFDGPAFEGYFNTRQADHNERARLANEAKERELKAEEERQQREREAQEREERARIAERERIEREQSENEVREARERAERERKAEVERREQEQQTRFQAFLKENGWTIDNGSEFKIEHFATTVVLWKKVAVFNKSQD
jgi:hypothetical protein